MSGLHKNVIHTATAPTKLNKINIFGFFSLDVPLDFPELHNKTPVQVEENWPVTLRCDVTSDSNPPLVWSWYCGEVLMESGVIYGGTWSELTFLASRTFHQRACYCQLQSESDKVFYNRTSQNLFIVVQSKTPFSAIRWKNDRSELRSNVVIYCCFIFQAGRRVSLSPFSLPLSPCS